MKALAAHLDMLIQDLRYTARTLNRARGFALTAILVTALGVGANTAAFSAADFVLLRPLPFADPDSLVRLCEGPRTGGGWGCMNQLSPANYRDFKTMSSSFEEMGAFFNDAVNLVGGGEPRRLAITRVTPEVLPLLGVKPVLGRVFESRQHMTTSTAPSSAMASGSRSSAATQGYSAGRSTSMAPPARSSASCRARSIFPSRDVQLWTLLTLRAEDFESRTNTYIEAVGRLEAGRHVRTDQSGALDAGRTPWPRLPGDQRGNRRQLLPDAGQHVAALPPDADGPRWREPVPAAAHVRESRQSAPGPRGRERARNGGARSARRGQGAAGAAADHPERDPGAARRRRSAFSLPPSSVPLLFEPRSSHAADRQSAQPRPARARPGGGVHGSHRRWGSASFPPFALAAARGSPRCARATAQAAAGSNASAPSS